MEKQTNWNRNSEKDVHPSLSGVGSCLDRWNQRLLYPRQTGGSMQIGDLVRAKHTEALLGIIVKRHHNGDVWLVQWNNHRFRQRSYEQEQHLEVVCK